MNSLNGVKLQFETLHAEFCTTIPKVHMNITNNADMAKLSLYQLIINTKRSIKILESQKPILLSL